MMMGVTIGESNTAMTMPRPGIAGLLRPSAASVPRVVAMIVAAVPISRLLPSAGSQRPSLSTLLYQRSDQASGSSRSMPSVKVKYGSALKLSGITTSTGATRKISTAAQNPRCSQRRRRAPWWFVVAVISSDSVFQCRRGGRKSRTAAPRAAAGCRRARRPDPSSATVPCGRRSCLKRVARCGRPPAPG